MTGKEWEDAVRAMAETLPHACVFANEPKMRAGYRVEGGTPDLTLIWRSICHLVECKESSGSSIDLGRLAKPERGKKPPPGVTWMQAATMTAAEQAGALCWVAVHLEVAESTRRRAAQVALDGTGGDMPAVIRRLVPWTLWRARMVAAEEARRTGGDVAASIPAVELAGLGYPLRTAGELRAALVAVDNPVDNSGGAS